MKEFDKESLTEFDGKDGKPVYVAHQGKVYDVSASRFWKTGTHMKRHPSGRDLTAEITAAPHGPEVLERYPQVGILKKVETTERPMPGWLDKSTKVFSDFAAPSPSYGRSFSDCLHVFDGVVQPPLPPLRLSIL